MATNGEWLHLGASCRESHDVKVCFYQVKLRPEV